MNEMPLTIISLDVTNFARIKAIRIEPNSSGAVVISGNNAQGKSSVLDAIATLIDSSKHKVAVPVHLGAEEANIVAVFGRGGEPEIVVKWKTTDSGKKTLVVEDADGVKQTSPAARMKSLFGYLSVNPFAFATADKDTQLKTLLGTTGFDVEEWQNERKDVFNRRTIINRELEKRKKSLDLMQVPGKDETREESSTTELLERLRNAEEVQSTVAAAEHSVDTWGEHVEDLELKLAEARSNLNQAIAYRDTVVTDENHNIVMSIPAITERLGTIDETNRAARLAQKYDETHEEYLSYETESSKMTTKIRDHDKKLRDAISGIDIPVNGLAYDEDAGITLNGIPFGAASHAEKLTIGTALAIASQPEAGVILVEDASLMDETTTDVIVRMAEKHGMQVWMETVGTDHGIVIEDGELANG